MAKTDLSKMSYSELVELAGEIQHLLNAKKEEAREKFLAEHGEIAKSLGLMITDPAEAKMPERRPRGPKPVKTGAVKYRDGDETWSGRGRQPRWLLAREAEGRKREEFLVG